MHASLANSLIRRARLWTGILAAAAAGAIFVPLGFSKPTAEKITLAANASKTGAAAALPPSYSQFTAALDSAELAAHLNKTAPIVPVTKPKEVPAKPGEAPTAAPPPPPPPPVWRYIGAIMFGDDRRAIVVVNEKQQIARVGDTIDGSSLKLIEADHLIVTDAAGADKRIDQAPRQIRALSVQEAAAPPPPVPLHAARGMDFGELGTDEATVGRLKGFYSQWEQDLPRMREPTVRGRLAKVEKMLREGDINPDDLAGHLKGLPRSPEFAELEHRFTNGDIDSGTFRKLATSAIGQQLETTHQPGDKFGAPGGRR